MNTNVEKFIKSLSQGTFQEKLSAILSDVALGVYRNGDGKKKGKVTIDFTFEQIGEEAQVIIHHKLSHSTPTRRGKRGEGDTTDTFMFIGAGGELSVDQPDEEPNGQLVMSGTDTRLRSVG